MTIDTIGLRLRLAPMPDPRFFPRWSLPMAAGKAGLWWRRYWTRQQLADAGPDRLRDIGMSASQARQEAALPFWSSGGRRRINC